MRWGERLTTATTRVSASVNTASLDERVTAAPRDSTDTQNALVRSLALLLTYCQLSATLSSRFVGLLDCLSRVTQDSQLHIGGDMESMGNITSLCTGFYTGLYEQQSDQHWDKTAWIGLLCLTVGLNATSWKQNYNMTSPLAWVWTLVNAFQLMLICCNWEHSLPWSVLIALLSRWFYSGRMWLVRIGSRAVRQKWLSHAHITVTYLPQSRFVFSLRVSQSELFYK